MPRTPPGPLESATPTSVARPATALVLGGNSDIGLAVIRRLAATGLQRVVLAVRDPVTVADRLEADPSLVAPLLHGGVDLVTWDALDTDAHARLFASAHDLLGSVDLVLCAVGSLGHHSGLTFPAAEAARSMRTNFVGPAAALLVLANALVDQGHGTIVVLSSVAAARARRSNFVYGSGKAGLDAFTQGLGDALVDTPVRVHLIRPGFVRSKMTEGLDPAPLSRDPEDVARAVAGVVGATRNRIVWVPAVLGPMLGVLRIVPAPLWRRIAGDR